MKLDVNPTLVLASTRIDQSLGNDSLEVDQEGNRVGNGKRLEQSAVFLERALTLMSRSTISFALSS